MFFLFVLAIYGSKQEPLQQFTLITGYDVKSGNRAGAICDGEVNLLRKSRQFLAQWLLEFDSTQPEREI